MPDLSSIDAPGFFLILSKPKTKQDEDEYHSWYNTEHGPNRMKLDFIKNGYRFKSIDDEAAVWAATYDLAKVSDMVKPEYTILRSKRSSREQNVLNNKVDILSRSIYKHLTTRVRDGVEGPPPIMMYIIFVVKNEYVEEVNRWYEEEHTTDLSKIPGWRRTRRFELVEGASMKDGYTELIAVHDFDKTNGLDGPEHVHGKSKPWRNQIVAKVESRVNRRFELYHEFKASDFVHPTETNGAHDRQPTPASELGPTDWHIEGPDKAPVVAFSNSLVTNLHIWDHTITGLKKLYPQKFRYLVYNTRGYSSDPQRDVDIDLLADDLANLLDHLHIDKCFAVVGVSLGGITALNFAIRHPKRLERFIACDCNVSSSEAGTKAWKERQQLAAKSWKSFADVTVKRWFTPASVEAQSPGLSQVYEGILTANQEGFVRCSDALCKVDIGQAIKNIQVPGLCVCGAQDGVLPATMSSVSKIITGSTYVEIPDAGHLPMMERPDAFVGAIQSIFVD